MHREIYELIYVANLDENVNKQIALSASIDQLIKEAFTDKNDESLLTVHRILYQLNLAFLGVSWELSPKNIMHPMIVDLKYKLEQNWENFERQRNQTVLDSLPDVANFRSWIKNYVQTHPSNELHPIFSFLRDAATFEQLREFFFQETPLEMLFGDIIALLLPGIYGSIKIEFLKNYWDEVGHAQDHLVHRNLRANLMQQVQIPADSYIRNYELFIREELELINLYLSCATNRSKHTQLVGALLATEQMIPGQFGYQIQGWKRFGLHNESLRYLIEHTSVDEIHAENWLEHVVMPILHRNPSAMTELILGVCRRLETSAAVLDRLYTRIRSTHIACIGAFKEMDRILDPVV